MLTTLFTTWLIINTNEVPPDLAHCLAAIGRLEASFEDLDFAAHDFATQLRTPPGDEALHFGVDFRDWDSVLVPERFLKPRSVGFSNLKIGLPDSSADALWPRLSEAQKLAIMMGLSGALISTPPHQYRLEYDREYQNYQSPEDNPALIIEAYTRLFGEDADPDEIVKLLNFQEGEDLTSDEEMELVELFAVVSEEIQRILEEDYSAYTGRVRLSDLREDFPSFVVSPYRLLWLAEQGRGFPDYSLGAYALAGVLYQLGARSDQIRIVRLPTEYRAAENTSVAWIEYNSPTGARLPVLTSPPALLAASVKPEALSEEELELLDQNPILFVSSIHPSLLEEDISYFDPEAAARARKAHQNDWLNELFSSQTEATLHRDILDFHIEVRRMLNMEEENRASSEEILQKVQDLRRQLRQIVPDRLKLPLQSYLQKLDEIEAWLR